MVNGPIPGATYSIGIHLIKDEEGPVLRPRVVAHVRSEPEKAHHCVEGFVSRRVGSVRFVPVRFGSVFHGSRQATTKPRVVVLCCCFHGGREHEQNVKSASAGVSISGAGRGGARRELGIHT